MTKINELKIALRSIGFDITNDVAKNALLSSGNIIDDVAFSYAMSYATPISQESSLAGPSSLETLTNDELTKLDEQEQLITALEDSKLSVTKEHAQVYSFIDWINANFKCNSTFKEDPQCVARRNHQREKLLKIFGKNNWDVIDPVGDGFCTIYAAFIDQGLVVPSGKDELILLIIQGMQKYFQVRDSLINEGIKPPRIMNDDILIQIGPDDILFVNKDTITNIPEMIERLQPLSNLGNTPVELLNFIPYAVNRNYLMLINDPNAKKVEDRYNLLFFPCYADFFNLEGDIIYPYENSTTLLYNNGHTFLFHNADNSIKLDTVNNLKTNPILWSRIMTGGNFKKTKKKVKKNKRKKSKKHKIIKRR
tara:strand:+ start:147 stop:1241 length:1095 start_codon:yes stop_codon:yes gene_type:complete